MPVAEQEAVYSLIESEYQDLVDQARSMGENILEADQLDLDARPLARMEVIADESETQSEFTGPVYLEVVDAKSETKPLTQLQVINAVRESLALETVEQVEDHDPDDLGRKGTTTGFRYDQCSDSGDRDLPGHDGAEKARAGGDHQV